MPLREKVSALMRAVVADVVMPRFQALRPEEISEKRPGEIVTIVDREAELWLRDGLHELGLGAHIIGEEAVEDQPELLEHCGTGLVWLIDPLDGTANFASGTACFGMMIALVEDGRPLAGWILDPFSGRLCFAEKGAGATCDGRPVRTQENRRSRLVAALGTQFLDSARRDRVHGHAAHQLDLVTIPRCAAESYPRLVFGDNDLALFQRILPWDHAAGILFLTEAGGHVTHWDQSPYRVGSPSMGVLAASSERHWERGVEILLGDAAGLIELEEYTA